MCAYALNLAKVQRVYFGQYNSRFGGCGSVMEVYKYRWTGGVMENESLQILKGFYERGNQRIPEEMRNRSKKKNKMK